MNFVGNTLICLISQNILIKNKWFKVKCSLTDPNELRIKHQHQLRWLELNRIQLLGLRLQKKELCCKASDLFFLTTVIEWETNDSKLTANKVILYKFDFKHDQYFRALFNWIQTNWIAQSENVKNELCWRNKESHFQDFTFSIALFKK